MTKNLNVWVHYFSTRVTILLVDLRRICLIQKKNGFRWARAMYVQPRNLKNQRHEFFSAKFMEPVVRSVYAWSRHFFHSIIVLFCLALMMLTPLVFFPVWRQSSLLKRCWRTVQFHLTVHVRQCKMQAATWNYSHGRQSAQRGKSLWMFTSGTVDLSHNEGAGGSDCVRNDKLLLPSSTRSMTIVATSAENAHRNITSVLSLLLFFGGFFVNWIVAFFVSFTHVGQSPHPLFFYNPGEVYVGPTKWQEWTWLPPPLHQGKHDRSLRPAFEGLSLFLPHWFVLPFSFHLGRPAGCDLPGVWFTFCIKWTREFCIVSIVVDSEEITPLWKKISHFRSNWYNFLPSFLESDQRKKRRETCFSWLAVKLWWKERPTHQKIMAVVSALTGDLFTPRCAAL